MLKHDRSTSFAKANFRIATDHLISFDVMFLLTFFWFSKLMALFKIFVCFQHKSRSATPGTFRDSAKTFLDIALDIAIYASVSNCVFGQ